MAPKRVMNCLVYLSGLVFRLALLEGIEAQLLSLGFDRIPCFVVAHCLDQIIESSAVGREEN